MNQIILIAGSTASGKSSLAVKLARQHNGVVINADSMQVYKDLCILSARPSLEDELGVEHRLYGFVEAHVEYSVGDYLRDAQACLLDVESRGKTPIFVGGTGLYFKALTQGMIETPLIPDSIRVELEARAQNGENLHGQLSKLDPITAERLSPLDTVRIIRALEVVETTGQSITKWQKNANSTPVLQKGTWHGMFLHLDREQLKHRIHQRFIDMVEAGALDEVKNVMKLNLKPNRGIMKAHGMPHLVAHLKNELSLDAAIALGQMDTRRYAKRQRTFARGQLPDFKWVDVA